jgi:putative PIN family toxin of toxin-antitoxin system
MNDSCIRLQYIVMSLTSASPYHVIFESLVNGKFVLAVSTDIVLEYEEIIQQKYNTATAKSFINLLNELINVSYVHPYYHWQLITADLDDNKYCDCAIAGQAEYIVTEDKHFSVLKTVSFPSLTVIGINRFLGIIQPTATT